MRHVRVQIRIFQFPQKIRYLVSKFLEIVCLSARRDHTPRAIYVRHSFFFNKKLSLLYLQKKIVESIVCG